MERERLLRDDGMSFAAAFQECASNTRDVSVTNTENQTRNGFLKSTRGVKPASAMGLGRLMAGFRGLKGRLVLAFYFSFLL